MEAGRRRGHAHWGRGAVVVVVGGRGRIAVLASVTGGFGRDRHDGGLRGDVRHLLQAKS